MDNDLTSEEQNAIEVMMAARRIQDFLWGDMNHDCDLEEFKRMFRKRVFKIDQVYMSNPHWKVELKKRLLQTAAIAVNMITKLDNGQIYHDGIHPTLPSNLPEFDVSAFKGDYSEEILTHLLKEYFYIADSEEHEDERGINWDMNPRNPVDSIDPDFAERLAEYLPDEMKEKYKRVMDRPQAANESAPAAG